MRTIYHPGLDRAVTVDDDAALHFAASGWLPIEEHRANLAEAAQREADEAAAAKAAARTKLKSGSSGEEA